MAKVPKLPNYDGVITAIRKSAKHDRKMADKQLKWAKNFYKTAKHLNKDVVADLREVMDFQLTNMKEDRARYEEVFQPLEDEQIAEINQFQDRVSDFDADVEQLKADAIAFKSEANQKFRAGAAQADVGQAFAAKKAQTERALLDAGVNPNSGASQSLTAGLNVAEGAAMAAAGTGAADATRQEGDARYLAALQEEKAAAGMASTALQLQGGMVQVGAALPGQIAQEAGQVGTAGAQAVDSTVAVGDAATRARSLATEWDRINASNLSTWSDTLTNKFNNKLGLYTAQLKAEELKQQESSGFGSILGTVLGGITSFLPGLEGGGAIEPEYVPGFDLGGGVGDTGVKDNVPAALTVGEFVVPKHVVDWKGQEFFQKLIKSAPEQKQALVANTGARASPVPAPQGALTI